MIFIFKTNVSYRKLIKLMQTLSNQIYNTKSIYFPDLHRSDQKHMYRNSLKFKHPMLRNIRNIWLNIIIICHSHRKENVIKNKNYTYPENIQTYAISNIAFSLSLHPISYKFNYIFNIQFHIFRFISTVKTGKRTLPGWIWISNSM